MKKKCRVYKKAGNTPKRLQDGGPAMTQDSQQDPVYEQKNAKFLDFLRTTTSDALLKEQLEQEKLLAKQYAQDGKEQKKYIPEYLSKGYNTQPGAVSNDYGYKKSNAGAFVKDYQNKQTNWNETLGDLYGLSTKVFNQPDVYQMQLPDGQTQQNIFSDNDDIQYEQTQLDNLDFTGYEKAGKRGKDRVMKYEAQGTKKYIGDKAKNVYEENKDILNSFTGFSQDGGQYNIYNDPAASADSLNTLGNKNRELEINRHRAILGRGTKNYEERADNFNRSRHDVERFSEKMSPELLQYYKENVEMQTPFRWTGPSYSMPYMDQFDAEGVVEPVGRGKGDVGNPILRRQNGGIGFPSLPGFNDKDFENYQHGYGFTEGAQPGPKGDEQITEDGEIYMKKQNKIAQAWNNPAIYPGGANVVMAGLTAIGNIDENRQREADAREQMSNVHRRFEAGPQDRGDYTANTFGFGDNLKPDQRTRMGYNTKIAQDGAEVGGFRVNDEVELTEEQINQLISQGYQLDYLD